MSNSSYVVFVILIIIQTYYVLSLPSLINCNDCDFKQLVVRNYFKSLIYSMEENAIISNDSTSTEQLMTDPTSTSTFTTVSEIQSSTIEQTMNLSVTIQSTATTFNEMTSNEYNMTTQDTNDSTSFSNITEIHTTIQFDTETTTTTATELNTATTTELNTTTATIELNTITTTELNTTTTTTELNTTTDNRISTTTLLTKSGQNLPLILGLTLGLGIPATVVVIGSLVYYLKIYRPRKSQVVVINY